MTGARPSSGPRRRRPSWPGTRASRGGSASCRSIAQHFAGRGRVMFVGTDSTFLWRQNVGDRFFYKFWGQAVRTLARRDEARNKSSWIEVRPARVQPDEPADIELMAVGRRRHPPHREDPARARSPAAASIQHVELTADPAAKGRYTGTIHAAGPRRVPRRVRAGRRGQARRGQGPRRRRRRGIAAAERQSRRAGEPRQRLGRPVGRARRPGRACPRSSRGRPKTTSLHSEATLWDNGLVLADPGLHLFDRRRPAPAGGPLMTGARRMYRSVLALGIVLATAPLAFGAGPGGRAGDDGGAAQRDQGDRARDGLGRQGAGIPGVEAEARRLVAQQPGGQRPGPAGIHGERACSRARAVSRRDRAWEEVPPRRRPAGRIPLVRADVRARDGDARALGNVRHGPRPGGRRGPPQGRRPDREVAGPHRRLALQPRSPNDQDLSVSVMQIVALRAAINAEIPVPAADHREGHRLRPLVRASRPAGSAIRPGPGRACPTSAAGVLSLQLLGQVRRPDPSPRRSTSSRRRRSPGPAEPAILLLLPLLRRPGPLPGRRQALERLAPEGPRTASCRSRTPTAAGTCPPARPRRTKGSSGRTRSTGRRWPRWPWRSTCTSSRPTRGDAIGTLEDIASDPAGPPLAPTAHAAESGTIRGVAAAQGHGRLRDRPRHRQEVPRARWTADSGRFTIDGVPANTKVRLRPRLRRRPPGGRRPARPRRRTRTVTTPTRSSPRISRRSRPPPRP